MRKQSNIIYWYRCGRTECDEEYIGESARTFEERFKEHLKAPSPIYEHDNTTGHKTSVENCKNHWKRGSWHLQNHPGGHLHQSEQPYSKQKCGKIQPATYLGQSSVHHPRIQNQLIHLCTITSVH